MKAKFFKDYFFYFAIFIFIEIVLFSALNYHKNEEIIEIEKSSTTRLNTQINAVLNYYNTTSELTITQILTDRKTQLLLQLMNAKDEQIKTTAREDLYWKLYDTYKLLTKYDFRQLHFHDKNGNSFLRFHQKNYFGDNLLDIRPTIKAVHDKKVQVKGFEEGKIVNGFRNVFPIFINDEFQGSVELSNSFDGISSNLHKNYPFEYKLIIDKNDVNTKLFPELIKKHYTESTISNNFYEESNQNWKKRYKFISEDEISQIDKIIKSKNLLELSRKQYVFQIDIRNTNYIVTALPLYNFDGSVTTYVISYGKNDAILVAKRDFYLSFLFTNLFLFIIIILVQLKKYINNSNEYAHKAYTDKLTGLYNRQKFELDYNNFFNNIHNKGKIALIIFDIDFFKHVNDKYGHHIGDNILQQFATVAKSTLRQNDFLYRWGGEEFIVILFNDDLALVGLIADKIRTEIEKTNFQTVGKVTGSFGVSIFCEGDTMESLFKRADDNLYISKNQGRNRVTI